MRILIVTDRFSPEISAASTRLHAHARAWAAEGHDVTVLTCAPNFPRGETFEGYRNQWVQKERMDNFDVVRVWTYMAPNTGVFRRSVDYVSFVVSSVLNSGAVGKVDVVLASSPPITVAFAGAILARRLGVPWVFEVRDLWPASIRAVGISKSPLLSILERLELWLYGDAAATIVLTEPFRGDLLGRGVASQKVRVVTNGIDPGIWTSKLSRAEARARFDLPSGAFLVGFVGTVGLAQGADVFVRAAERLRNEADIHFLCLGEGAGRPQVEAIAAAAGLTNITFRDFVPFDLVPDLLRALDVGAILLKDDPVFDTVIPSKLFELMAAAVPIAASAGKEVQRLLCESEAGVCVAPEDDAALASALLALKTDPAARSRAAARGSAFVKGNFNRQELAMRALQVLRGVVEGGPK